MSSSTGEPSHSNAGPNDIRGPGYETSDANPRAILVFLGFLGVALCATLFVVWLVFRHFSVSEVGPPPASSFAEVRQVPSGPQLQVEPRTDLLEMRAKQQQQLESYAWEDRKSGVVRIPIEKAMDLLMQKGLPVLPSATVQQSAPVKAAKKEKTSAAGISAALKEPGAND